MGFDEKLLAILKQNSKRCWGLKMFHVKQKARPDTSNGCCKYRVFEDVSQGAVRTHCMDAMWLFSNSSIVHGRTVKGVGC